MAARGRKPASDDGGADQAPPDPPATAATDAPPGAVRLDTAALGTKALAKAILAREVRPRVGEIRRLAEAVLKKKSKKKSGKDSSGAKRKLSKIPAPKVGK